MKPWKQLSTEVKFKNPWWEYIFDIVELPNGKKGEYHYVRTGGAVLVVPVLPSGEVVMIEQYRYLMRRDSIEFVTGSLEEGETIEEAAHRECAEETGQRAGRLEKVGEFSSYNGVSDEMTTVFLAHDMEDSDVTPDDTEELKRHMLTPQQIDAWIADGTIWDGMVIAGWHLIRPRLVE